MNDPVRHELTPEELEALRALAQERIRQEEVARKGATPYVHTYDVEVEGLRAEGIEVGQERFCWLRLRRHRFRGYYWSGSPDWGYTWKLCIDCGHSRKQMVIGRAIDMYPR